MTTKQIITQIAFALLAINTSAQTVSTQYGEIQGSINGSVYQFLGIPYAKPPVGNLRWADPLEPDNWQGILNTTDFAPVCPQKNFDTGGASYTIEGNEDCLYLNVWTPQLGLGNRPVLVFIHGGGNQQGSTREENGGTLMFFGKHMAERGNAVVVTIQYRLGPLGFLVHPGLNAEGSRSLSGNYAVLDQILALKWVRSHISSFGGDPQKVMVFGESAGGLNVGNLMVSPMAEGLFQRAAIQSAAPVIATYADASLKGIAYVQTYTTEGDDAQKIAYMRGLTSDELVMNETAPLSGGAVGLNWLPIIDGHVFEQRPTEAFQSGKFNKVPFLIGSNSEEMSLSAPTTVYPFMVTALINNTVPLAQREEATLLYPPGTDNTQAKTSYIALLTDAQFTSTVRRTAQCVVQNQTEPVWRYFFTYKHSIAQLAELGSYHGMELFYVFNNWENATLGKGIFFKPSDASVQDAMLRYWVNFADTGNPNGGGLEPWPQWTPQNDCYLEINATPNGTQCGVRTTQCIMWDKATGYVGCGASTQVTTPIQTNGALVHPNPFDDLITVRPPVQGASFNLMIYNTLGRKMTEQSNLSTIDLTTLPKGIYILVLEQNGQHWQSKVLKR